MTRAAPVPPYAAPQQGVEAQPTNGCPQTPVVTGWVLAEALSRPSAAPRGSAEAARPDRGAGPEAV
jgi:hypothetical protein